MFQVFQECFKGVSRVFQGCFNGGVSRVFKVSLKLVVFQGCLKLVSRVFQGCFKGVQS